MYAELKILDSHAHFPVDGPWIPGADKKEPEPSRQVRRSNDGFRAQEQWRKAWGFQKAERQVFQDEETARRWVTELDTYGIEKIVWVTGGGNERLSKIVNLAPDRFIGYAHHDLFEENAAEILEHAVTKLGLKGYKLLAPTLSKTITDKSAYPVWEVCAKYQIPVLIHFGILGAAGGTAFNDNINPQIMESVCKDFPDVNFIIPHFGCGHPRELLFLGWVCENVYVDTSGSNQWMRWMPYPFTVDSAFAKFYQTFGPERIIFGTDSSYFPRGFAIDYLKEQNKAVRFLSIPDDHAQLIFGGNMARLLQIDL